MKNYRVKNHAFVALLLTLLCTSASSYAYTSVGIVDGAGRVIVPALYHNCIYLGQGLFFAEEIDKVNPIASSHTGVVFDSNGRKLPIKLPLGCTLVMAYLPGPALRSAKLLTTLPSTVILAIHGIYGFGYATVDGKILLAPREKEMWPVFDQYAYAHSEIGGPDTSISYTLNLRTGERISAPPESFLDCKPTGDLIPFRTWVDNGNRYGYLAKNGSVAIQPKFAEVSSFDAQSLAIVSMQRDGRKMFIDKIGSVVSPEYEWLAPFDQQYAAAGTAYGPSRKVGLIDRAFKVVLPADYFSLDYIGDGVYAARKTPDGKLFAITASGKIQYEIPVRIVEFEHWTDDRHTVCYVTTSSGKVWCSLEPLPAAAKGAFPYKLVSRPNHQPPLANRFFKYVEHDEFNAAAWKNPNPDGNASYTRDDMLTKFLASHNLIGMPRAKVIEWLGEPQNDGSDFSYRLNSGPCGNGALNMEIEFVDGKVYRWRKAHLEPRMGRATEWVTIDRTHND